MCYRCFKPEPLCVCDALPRVPNRTALLVLQHPRERFHPLGTARFVELGLERARVQVARGPNGLWGLQTRPALAPGAGLLYPSPDAMLLDDLAPADAPQELVVLDGTWHHARRLYLENPWLKQLPHYRLAPEQPSRYRIRREPRADYVSTLESIALALEVLEPELGPGLQALLGRFDAMIDAQIQAASTHRAQRVRVPRVRGARALPRCLGPERERLVVVFGESRGDVPGERRGREPLVWVAQRPADGAHFRAVLRPRVLPGDRHLAHLELQREELLQGETPEAAAARFRRWLGHEPVIAAWHQSTLDLLAGFCPGQRTLLLKAVYCNLRREGPRGELEQVLAREGLEPPEPVLPGRAGRRLANALAMAEHLRRVASQASGS